MHHGTMVLLFIHPRSNGRQRSMRCGRCVGWELMDDCSDSGRGARSGGIASLASSLTAGSPSSPSAEMASKEDRRLEDM